MKLRHLGIVAVCFLIAIRSFADISDKWGKGEKQQDGSTVYKRTFEVPASHWEPNNITNYFVDLEYTKLQIAEVNGDKYLHMLCLDQEKDFQENTREITIRRDDRKQIREMSFSLGKYYYVDLNEDGKLDLLHDHMNNRSFIMTKDQMLRVSPKRTKDQDVQTSFDDEAIYKHQNGEWVQQSNGEGAIANPTNEGPQSTLVHDKELPEYPNDKHAPEYNETILKNNFEKFMNSLNYKQVAKDYPQAIQKLSANDPKYQIEAIKTLAATKDIAIIYWILPFLNSKNIGVQTWAGAYLEEMVSSIILDRRDTSKPGIVIKPFGTDDIDLSPLAWIVLNLFQKPDDGSMRAYAATIAGYLELKFFKNELWNCLQSKHPATRDSARYALEIMKLAEFPSYETSKVEIDDIPIIIHKETSKGYDDRMNKILSGEPIAQQSKGSTLNPNAETDLLGKKLMDVLKPDDIEKIFIPYNNSIAADHINHLFKNSKFVSDKDFPTESSIPLLHSFTIIMKTGQTIEVFFEPRIPNKVKIYINKQAYRLEVENLVR